MKKRLRWIAAALALALLLPLCAAAQTALAESEFGATFTNLVELRDYLCQRRDAGEREISFTYTNDEKLTAQTTARILNAYYVSLHWEGADYTLTLWLYPGERIIEAWRSGDASALSDDEKRAYDKAVQIVEEARASAASDLELERLLHDWLCENVCYVESSTEIDDPEVPNRPLTALGAILDGEANCQGYTDAFYLLGTLAGFEIGRQSVEDSRGGHSLNTICLNGAWYAVDVLYDDNNDHRNYRLFNAGRDEIHEYSWAEEYEYHPIAQTGGVLYFYNLGLDGYAQSYTGIEEMAAGVLDAWQEGGFSQQYVRLVGSTAEWSVLSDAIKSEAIRRGIGCSWNIWATSTSADTFFSVDLTQK